ncbi:TLDc domain-containing protein [Chloropicon primus]|uniref:Oxidation resistance protein 1 n=1 Tax=Chloropicon primus TaxID=1764295 RepID=A0A5B8MET9_9CHLO|nr:TLDc domain-containing protein [Chloropicon primus]UPQ97407.1 TLDc domain-containing protein [Chloropicon primus]|eukprot:QDZ18195.1 TLDc domain-containing protein [Chloropicon primus]
MNSFRIFSKADEEGGEGGSQPSSSRASSSSSLRRLVSEKATSLLSSITATIRSIQRRGLAKRLEKVTAESDMLLEDHVVFLMDSVPPRFKQQTWRLLYSTSKHGFSLQTFYRRVSNAFPTVLLVKDVRGSIFGAFATDPYMVQHKYYGTGETFVFKLHPDAEAYRWKYDKEKGSASQNQNDFFLLSTEDCIGFGGGGRFALWIDQELLHGSSSCSPTFEGLERLSEEENFTVQTIEVWSLGD